MNLKIITIKQAAMHRYQLVIDDNQAQAIKDRTISDCKVQDLLLKLKKLPRDFIQSGIHAAGLLAILLGLITVWLALSGQTNQFPKFFYATIQGLIFGQISIYTLFYLYYWTELRKISNKLMFLNIASLHHSLREWKIEY